MSNYNAGLQQYREQSVNTMTNGEMLVLLYDEGIKRLNKAKICLEHHEPELFSKEVERAKEIVKYLRSTLDKNYPISNEIDRLYEYIDYELIRLEVGHNAQVIDEILPLFKDFRDSFKEAEKRSKLEVKQG